MVAKLAHSANHSDQAGEAEANARLIAAAPDLLAALEALYDHPSYTALDDDELALWDAAKTAIAKAKGPAT